MIKKLVSIFGITEEGAKGVKKASFWSMLVFFSYIIPMMIIMFFVQETLSGNRRSPIFYIILLLIGAVILFVIHTFQYNTSYGETYKECANLRLDITRRMKDLPLSYFSTHDLSDLSQTIMKDVADIEHSLSHAIPQAIGFIVYFVIMSVMLIIGNWKLGLAIVIPILLSYALMFISKRINIKNTTKYYYSLRENSEIFQETIEMQQEIRSYGQVDRFKDRIFKKIEENERVHWKSEFTLASAVNLSILILKVIIGIVILLGTVMYVNGEISLFIMLAYLLAAVKIADGLEVVYEYIAMMFFFDASYKRIKELKSIKLQEGEDMEIENFDISVENVKFSYLKNGENVINDATFEAKQNEVTALIGPSGCGKSTMLRLISRLYDYDFGKITLGGKDIKSISTKSLFDKVSFVFQDVVLFNGSVLDNIRIGKSDATEEEVIEAARLANVDEFVQKLPDGYNTLIGENGSKLSGGERQRISIARAFLKNAPIVILDEISASLDVENEMKIQQSLNKLIKNKTVIIISHRLKSIENVDKIVLMDKGKVLAAGKHNELLKTSSLYQNLVNKSKLTEDFVY